MATKSMSYDHPAYTTVAVANFSGVTGSAAASTKFIAFTGLLLKSVTLKPTTAGTSNDVASLISISGTTTTTTAIATYGSGVVTSTNVSVSTLASLSQGDQFYVVKGTDATEVLAGAVEFSVQPLANVTV